MERVSRLEESQARLRAEMQALTERVSGLEEGQTQLRADMQGLAERVGRLEQSQARMNEVLETLSAGQDKLSERVSQLEQSQARMNEVLGTLSAGQDKLSERGESVGAVSGAYGGVDRRDSGVACLTGLGGWVPASGWLRMPNRTIRRGDWWARGVRRIGS